MSFKLGAQRIHRQAEELLRSSAAELSRRPRTRDALQTLAAAMEAEFDLDECRPYKRARAGQSGVYKSARTRSKEQLAAALVCQKRRRKEAEKARKVAWVTKAGFEISNAWFTRVLLADLVHRVQP